MRSASSIAPLLLLLLLVSAAASGCSSDAVGLLGDGGPRDAVVDAVADRRAAPHADGASPKRDAGKRTPDATHHDAAKAPDARHDVVESVRDAGADSDASAVADAGTDAESDGESDAVSDAGSEAAVDAGVDAHHALDGSTGVYEAYLPAPIELPGAGAGVDLYGGKTHNGSEGWNPADPGSFHYDPSGETPGAVITLAQVKAILGPPTVNDRDGGGILEGPQPIALWGQSEEISVIYKDDGKVTDLLFGPAYQGLLQFKSANRKHAYVVSLDSAYITKATSGGAPADLLLDWTDSGSMNAVANELYDALRATFYATLPPVPDCTVPTSDGGSANCVVGNNGGAGGYFYFVPFNMVIYFASTIGTAAEGSQPLLIDFTNPAAL